MFHVLCPQGTAIARFRSKGYYIWIPDSALARLLEHNYELLAHLEEFRIFELPLLVGVSRKSMIYRLLGTTPQEALNGTTVLDTICFD